MYKRKYKKGFKIKGVHTAIAIIVGGNGLYFHDKYMCAAWLKNWSISQINNAVIYGRFWSAVRVKS